MAVQAVVPTPGTDTAVIMVRVGGDRLSGAITDTGPADAATSGLPGVRLGLLAAPGDTAPIAEAWATCVSDDAGDCSFTVPQTQPGGANRDARFTVVQLAAPTGWTLTTRLRTYSSTSGHALQPYRFLTGPELRAGSTYSSLSDFMYAPATAPNFGVVTASSGVSQLQRVNPSVRDRCGLDVAIIIDTSSSVGTAMPQLVAAADSLVDALTGTRSRAAAFSFSALSPGAAAGPNHPELTSLSTAAGAASFKQEYAGWQTSVGTSWDRGLFAAAAASERYDVAVVITDGNPTSYGDPRPAIRSVQATRFKEIEYGIASANALKAEGTRVVALGVGSGIGLGPISGPTAYDGSHARDADQFTLADYGAAGDALRTLATELCQGSVSVVTALVPPGAAPDDVSGATPVGAGWSLAGTTDATGVTGLPGTATTSDDGTGAVNLPVGFTSGLQEAPITMTPTTPAGYHVVARAGQNAACRDLGSGAPVEVGNAGDSGFRVVLRASAALTCTVYVAADEVLPTEFPLLGDGVVQAYPAPLITSGRVTGVRDVDGDGRVGAGDAVSYEFGVTNSSAGRLTNVQVISPALGAVVCPRTTLEAGASMTCTGHAPYVVTDADEVRGSFEVGGAAEAVDASGFTLSSASSAVATAIGDLITILRTARERA